MNPENYGSREACERLLKAGIVLETDVHWCRRWDSWELQPQEKVWNFPESIPAPSMTDAWRELPNNVLPEALNGLIRCRFDKIKEEDYLIDLLIWVRKEGGRE